MQVKQTKTFSLGSDGQLRLATKGDDLECSTASEWKLRMALQRKSLAMDLAGLVSYQVSETWHTYLYTVREREVPKDTKQVSLQQILDADKRLWILLSEEVRGKIVAAPGSAPTCDAVIQRLSSSNDVLSYLVPQPEFRGPSLPRWEPYTSTGVKGKGKGKGKEKNKGKASEATPTISIPEGAHSTTSDGKPLCFLYSRGKCWAKKKPGPRAIIFAGSASKNMPVAIALTRAADFWDPQAATLDLVARVTATNGLHPPRPSLGHRTSSARSVVVSRGH